MAERRPPVGVDALQAAVLDAAEKAQIRAIANLPEVSIVYSCSIRRFAVGEHIRICLIPVIASFDERRNDEIWSVYLHGPEVDRPLDELVVGVLGIVSVGED
ncbi:hypothetical protein COU37_02250 [Candidatus Micrarchaeota archaeon CG10_big_fil_rev_8_21_14_0_10_45_29]|nr:MAG: hypothetical protein COU37_02250 [Candidatus Micrarchaeota archaeon CG10_big_fil_rev_8_21_14_0_10_45_29]